MSKRRISKQQSTRIEKTQQAYLKDKALYSNELADGLVLSHFSKHVEIEDNQGARILCSIRPNLGVLVAGDRVVWQLEGTHQGVVLSLYPRASMLAKPTSAGIKKPVAANITQIIIVLAPQPEISWPLLDSYLIMAETLRLHAVILMNKTDILEAKLKKELLKDYEPLGYPILFTNRKSSASYEELRKTLNHQVSVFVGQSGVGKSSLIAEILPHEEDIMISHISANSKLGRHTTSNSRYYHLPSGGALIDSPGVREFSLWHMNAHGIAQGYKEFRSYIGLCKYRNCLHLDTPNCAIIDAVQCGFVAQKRYDNFLKLCAQFALIKH